MIKISSRVARKKNLRPNTHQVSDTSSAAGNAQLIRQGARTTRLPTVRVVSLGTGAVKATA